MLQISENWVHYILQCPLKSKRWWSPAMWREYRSVVMSVSWTVSTLYYMASSMSGQDEPNRVLWLATRVGKIERSCPLETTCHVPWENFPWNPHNKSFIDQACSVKMVGYWPHSFLWTLTPSRFINMQRKELGKNIEPSWPHAWPVTHIHFISTGIYLTVFAQTFYSGKKISHAICLFSVFSYDLKKFFAEVIISCSKFGCNLTK